MRKVKEFIEIVALTISLILLAFVGIVAIFALITGIVMACMSPFILIAYILTGHL